MALHPLKYKVSDRWLDDEVYDTQGFRIKTPISKRGTTITHISDDIYRRIQNRWLKGETSTESVWKKSKTQASQPHKSRLERAVRGTTRNTGIPVRVRKKK